MTDSTCLTGDTAALNVSNDVELAHGIGDAEGLVNDELKGLKAEVLVNVTAVYSDVTGSGIKANAGYRALSSAGSVEIRLSTP